MKDRVEVRHLFFGCLLVCAMSLTACRYITNFVVVNASDQPVRVQYILKKPVDPIPPDQLLRLVPSVLAISELHQQIPWRDLSVSQYTFDPGNRKVVVSLEAGQALLVERCAQEGREVTDAEQAADFSIEEITITGAHGETKFQGDHARKSFVAESKNMHTLTYR